MPSIATSRGLKIAYRCLLIPKKEAAGGLRCIINYKFVLKCPNFQPLRPPATLLTSIGVSHKLDSGKKVWSCNLKFRPRAWRWARPADMDSNQSAGLARNSAISRKSDIPDWCILQIVGASRQVWLYDFSQYMYYYYNIMEAWTSDFPGTMYDLWLAAEFPNFPGVRSILVSRSQE